MQKSVFIGALTLILASSAFAQSATRSDVITTPVAYQSSVHGKTASALIRILAKAGAQPSVRGNHVSYAVRNVEVRGYSHSWAEPGNPFYKKETYDITFWDRLGDFSGKRQVTLSESQDLQATRARDLGLMLGRLGGNKVADAAMGGRFYYQAPAIDCGVSTSGQSPFCSVTVSNGLVMPDDN